MYFKKESVNRTIESFLSKAHRSNIEDDIYNKRLERCADIISFIHDNPVTWSENCAFNIEAVGDRFIDAMDQYTIGDIKYINDIYVIAYRFLCEYEFSLVDSGLHPELRHMRASIEDEGMNLGSEISSQIIYASYQMPVHIVKRILNNSNISSSISAFSEFSEKIDKANNLKKNWDEEIKEKEDVVNGLKDSLSQYRNAFNFVGLHQGFNDLSEDKEKERGGLLKVLVFMGLCVTFFPVLFHFYIYSGGGFLSNILWENVFLFIPFLSIEIILLYFFRIVLQNYKSVKTQIIQLELRKTLCQFIQSYSEYSVDIKKDDPSALEKFEGIIFSSILSDSEKLPSTFDGIEQISAFIKGLKSS